MFSWVVKVVPQPPDAPGTLGDEAAKTSAAEVSRGKEVKNQEVKRIEVKSPPVKNTSEEASEESQTQTGVLGWLSNGFVSALPQPSSPGLHRANSTSGAGEDGERTGVISWVAQGLTKVLPQPDEKYREIHINAKKVDEVTEVFDAEEMPDYDPLPHIPVVEMVSEDEMSEVDSLTSNFPPRVVSWIKQVIPQPILLPPGAVPLESAAKTNCHDKIVSPPPESLSGISLDTDGKAAGMVGWFVSGLGLRMPQPVVPPKDDAVGAAEVLNKASYKLKPDMVLEDVESDNEGKGEQEDRSKPSAASAPSAALAPPSLAAKEPQPTHSSSGPAQLQRPASESGTKFSQEDAETQTGRWTPFINSIKKEAEDVAIATMEERLLQERIEMVRMAEEVARQTAEMAIRQMAAEGQSIKLSLGSQELLEGPEIEKEQSPAEEEQEQREEEEEQEEEEEEEEAGPEAAESVPPPEPVQTQELTAREPDLATPEPEEAAEPPRSSPSPPPNPEPGETPEAAPDAQERSTRKETKTAEEAGPGAQPVTQQPAKAAEGSPGTNAGTAADKEAEAAGEGSSAPASCDMLKSCLMRIPHASECFGNINAYFKENGISPPKIPPMPKLPTQLSDVTNLLPSLPPELRQEFSQIRLTQVPRSIVQTLSELIPRGSDGFSVPPQVSNLTQSLSAIPQKLSQIPSRTQQYYLNIQNRLNSLMPQDA